MPKKQQQKQTCEECTDLQKENKSLKKEITRLETKLSEYEKPKEPEVWTLNEVLKTVIQDRLDILNAEDSDKRRQRRINKGNNSLFNYSKKNAESYNF